MRDGFLAIVQGWMLHDDYGDITERIEEAATWTKQHGPLQSDEEATIKMMIQAQLLRATEEFGSPCTNPLLESRPMTTHSHGKRHQNEKDADASLNPSTPPPPETPPEESVTTAPTSRKASGPLTRCKVVCSTKNTETGALGFTTVVDGSDENKKFFQATPSGVVNFQTVNKEAVEAFEINKEYYVDFTPAN